MTNKQVTGACKADHVGSFLRPAHLKEARAQYEQGEITEEALREVETQLLQTLWKSEKKQEFKL